MYIKERYCLQYPIVQRELSGSKLTILCMWSALYARITPVPITSVRITLLRTLWLREISQLARREADLGPCSVGSVVLGAQCLGQAINLVDQVKHLPGKRTL